MTRPLKFRAWHKNNFFMSIVDRIDFKKNEIWINNGCIHESTYLHPDDCELMQFIGLHDKRGKEIYEGDIVEGEIKSLKYGIEVVELCKEYSLIGYNLLWQKCKVIGNIHEHLHLLENKQ